MRTNKTRKGSGQKPRARKYGLPDNAALIIIVGAIVLSIVFIGILVVTSPA